LRTILGPEWDADVASTHSLAYRHRTQAQMRGVNGPASGYPRRMDPIPSKTVTVAEGAVTGVCATLVMSLVLAAGQRWTSFATQPQTLIVRTVLAGGRARRLPAEGALAALAHLGYGGSCGALFALLTRRRPMTNPLLGVGYALVLWSASYGGWVPAVGAMPPPHRDQPGRQLALVAGHVVYGGVLAAALRRRRAPTPLRHRPPEGETARRTPTAPSPSAVEYVTSSPTRMPAPGW
jgi:hypothetical protein